LQVGTTAAVNMAAAPATQTSPTLFDPPEIAGNAVGIEKKVSGNCKDVPVFEYQCNSPIYIYVTAPMLLWCRKIHVYFWLVRSVMPSRLQIQSKSFCIGKMKNSALSNDSTASGTVNELRSNTLVQEQVPYNSKQSYLVAKDTNLAQVYVSWKVDTCASLTAHTSNFGMVDCILVSLEMVNCVSISLRRNHTCKCNHLRAQHTPNNTYYNDVNNDTLVVQDNDNLIGGLTVSLLCTV
jgi:hypothetical protein